MSVTMLDEAEFFERIRSFLVDLYGPDHEVRDLDQDLVHDLGLTSLQLIELIGHVEHLRGEELDDAPSLSGLTVRVLHRELYAS